MNIAVIRKTFVNEWVAAEVTKTDQADTPLAGEVVIHSSEKPHVYQAAKTYLTQHPTARLFIFFTGDPIPDHVEVMLALC